MKVFKRLISTLKNWMKLTVNYNRVSPFGVMYDPVIEPLEPVSNKPIPVGEAEQPTLAESNPIPYQKEYWLVNDGKPMVEPNAALAISSVTVSADQPQSGVEVNMSTTDTVATTTTTEQVVPVTYHSPGHAIGLDHIMVKSSELNELDTPTPVTHSIEVFVEAARKPRLRAKKEVTPAPEPLVPLKAKRKRNPRKKVKKNQSGETK